MSQPKRTSIDPRILALAASVTKKRPKTVIDHIIKNGFITNEELKEQYGYNHPPRAIRDVREEGIPLDLYKVQDRTGRSIGAYRFSDPSKITGHKLGGRRVFSKPFKQRLLDSAGSRCALCSEKYEDRYLTIDHRVPYEVVGDGASDEHSPESFMLACGTCQRKKSWSCEHCSNWTNRKDDSVCKSCYWAVPENYEHMAQRIVRRVEVVWADGEVADYEKLKSAASKSKVSIQDVIKCLLKN